MRSIHALCLSIVVLAVAPTWGAACAGEPTFRCTSNVSCVSPDGQAGLCETTGYCGFPDTACADSGRRYADRAGDGLGGSCVAAPQSEKCIAQIALGTDHSCALRTDGAVFCWGDNTEGELGDGTTTDRPVPTRVALPAGKQIAALGAGEGHTCALDKQGGVWCWGSNSTHELATKGPNSSTPLAVPIFEPDSGSLLTATALTVGGKHACALAGGAVYCWGENSDGQCGQDPAKYGDVQAATEVAGLGSVVLPSSGDEFSCALKDDKTVWCWGANANGELGDGNADPSFVPVKVVLPSVSQLAAGDEHACGAKNDGSIWCWGYGASGALGVGNEADEHAPVLVTTAQSVTASGESFHTCAISWDARLSCWGANESGQLGAQRKEASVPVPVVADLVTVKMVAVGGKHTCAVTVDGALWCWGANDAGQLGVGTMGGNVETPQRIAFGCGG